MNNKNYRLKYKDSHPISFINLQHSDELMASYDEVGLSTWSADDFAMDNLEVSRNLFTKESVAARRPRPMDVEVYALLSGIPFETEFVNEMIRVQRQIAEIINESIHYWVKPANLGVEYCVFKWPNGIWKNEWISTIQDAIASIVHSSFKYTIGGIQINPDGCVIAKGIDENRVILQIREYLKSRIPFLPARQSRWAHVPLGRILEPIGTVKFKKLAELISDLSSRVIATTVISSVKLVHETRWYMEKKEIITEYFLVKPK